MIKKLVLCKLCAFDGQSALILKFTSGLLLLHGLFQFSFVVC
jgi:hypothetical protein